MRGACVGWADAKESARKPTKAAAKELTAHHVVPEAKGDGAMQTGLTSCPIATAAGLPPRSNLPARFAV